MYASGAKIRMSEKRSLPILPRRLYRVDTVSFPHVFADSTSMSTTMSKRMTEVWNGSGLDAHHPQAASFEFGNHGLL